MKRFLTILLCILVLVSMVACSTTPPSAPLAKGGDGVIKGKRSEEVNGHDGIYYSAKGELAEACDDIASIPGPGPAAHSGIQPGAGTMTGAELRDILDMHEWRKGFDDQRKTWAINRGLDSETAIDVYVMNGNIPIYNCPVTLCDDQGNTVYEARTDVFGCAILCCSAKEYSKRMTIKVNGEVKAEGIDIMSMTSFGINDGAKGTELKELDLMLMVDTTGSMGDELDYLKAELVDIVERVSEGNEMLSVRTSVNFYRDETDEYIVKYYDFRDDIHEAVELIKQQKAEGGGDFPEAVHTALDNAVNTHVWRENAVKLCFFVLDAPPHTEDGVQGVTASLRKSIKTAAAKGIKIIPVAASGIDEETEFILRSFAVMTGGTYIFITDDSGIGESHLVPDIQDYKVEPLNECIIRVIDQYCGIQYTAPQQ